MDRSQEEAAHAARLNREAAARGDIKPVSSAGRIFFFVLLAVVAGFLALFLAAQVERFSATSRAECETLIAKHAQYESSDGAFGIPPSDPLPPECEAYFQN